jgi:phosphoglycerate dehydrogenase-like enzyme
MKSTAWLLNFARGSLIVDADLIAAVQSKTIAGAVLDVFREEPLPASHPSGKPKAYSFSTSRRRTSERSAAVAEIFASNARRFRGRAAERGGGPSARILIRSDRKQSHSGRAAARSDPESIS